VMLPTLPPPKINSNMHDLLLDGRPIHGPTEMHGYMDAEWATCPITRRSMGGGNLIVAGGTVGFKAGLLPTIAMSSTEAEYMEAAVMGRMYLYCRSVMWDLGVPQCSAAIAYEDNDACTMMAQAQKPTPRARHIDIKYHVICQWVEDDLMRLERISTTMNIADIFTKQLGPLLYRRHCDYLMGRVPPQYSSHYQDLHLMTNPVRLGGTDRESGAEERFMAERGPRPTKADGTTHAAAAAMLWTDHWSSGPGHDALWRMVTRFWSRRCETFLVA
jgi:hypothetical protein